MRRRTWWFRSSFNPPPENAIRLKSTGDRVGTNWWARQWVMVLEGAAEKGRLSRARNCARTGRGERLRIREREVRMGICCSGYTVRDVLFRFPLHKEEVWDRLVSRIASDAALTGALLSGELSEHFADELKAENFFLIPEHYHSIATFCSCGDGHPPCIHIAFAWYLFAEVLDQDPWHLLMLHGLSKDELTRRVREAREIEAGEQSKAAIPRVQTPGGLIEIPTRHNPAGFFSINGDTAILSLGQRPHKQADPLVLIGPSPVKLGGKNLSDRVASLYPWIQEYAGSLAREGEMEGDTHGDSLK